MEPSKLKLRMLLTFWAKGAMRSKAPEMEVFLLQVSEQVNESLEVDVLVVLRGQTWKKKKKMMMM